MQSPHWGQDFRSVLYNVDSSVRITIPFLHSVVVSYQHSSNLNLVTCRYGQQCQLCGWFENDRSDRFRRHMWEPGRPFPIIHSARALRVKLKCRTLFGLAVHKTGFRLLFSFHQESALPVLLWKWRWNCSVPHWADFQEHFPCNLEADCVHGEDEQDCPYTNVSRCGAGAISLGESCYFYVISENDVSWQDAMDACQSSNAYLANLNTPKEWDDVMQLLFVRRGAIFLGLRSSDSYLPF